MRRTLENKSDFQEKLLMIDLIAPVIDESNALMLTLIGNWCYLTKALKPDNALLFRSSQQHHLLNYLWST